MSATTCSICDGFICGKPLKNLYNIRDELILQVCDYCYRGLYGFRYSPALLKTAASLMEKYEAESNFMVRRPENDNYYRKKVAR